ncbi:hypothetical protein [Paenibacillus mucilaginosus]|uniref:Uncharacterized protein n=2 Tax=Paenibacillus mucilaginosus TaxID=61624 RepID=H6NQU4_9BACL|nr:hypothetical protein [Paenibacillus mucilaginosus]AEI44406.1 hypothetical protein KNP414_05882 [Paenibacillus mucilaginosus KNP414]AFC31937.1 hypothetical protein PM3016_5222 [Paenibacillus mucilaginosus 3016]MCG7213784.1 hypothetical protein [Paenibacillus mucilaginosus]WDM25796.1 hypothetical protein KCX80_25575 [Paenibacillus mucilaginosus]WFA20451.1 hypothetical protein ERY13_26040 [Paenibacillus mucilaginosus]
MVRLEYRLYEEGSRTFPVLYSYDRIGRDEAALRFACDYFVKDGRVYEKTSCAVETGCYVVYVKEAEDERTMPWGAPGARGFAGVRMELREYREGTADYPLIYSYTFRDTLEAMLHLQANYLYTDGREWYRTSAEIDEDRMTYVYYAVPV